MTAVALLVVVSLGPLNIEATSGEGNFATCKFEIHLFFMPCITHNWNYQAIMLFIENGLIGALSFFAASGRIGMESFRSRDRVPRPSSHGASARCISRSLLKLSSAPVLGILAFKSLIAVQF